jgi:5'-nucleotidase
LSVPPRILLTNDDGVDAPGLARLRKMALTLSDDVWTVAPTSNRSGAGHAFSLATELRLEPRGERIFALDGTPADCVVAGMTEVLKEKKADIVLSGVNRGQNIADLIHCSGTVAGAREGALHGAIGIAFSQGLDYSADHLFSWDVTEAHGPKVLATLVEAAAGGGDVFYNVNFPYCAPEDVLGIRVVPHQRLVRSPFEHYPSDNPGGFFVAILDMPQPHEPGGDQEMLLVEDAITVTPLMLQQTHLPEMHRLRERLQRATASGAA